MTDFKTLNNLVPEIVTHENLSESFDYVVRDLKPEQKERIKKKRMPSSTTSMITSRMEVFKSQVSRTSM